MKFNYLSMIAEITAVASMPTECIDDMEYQDYQQDMAQRSLEYFSTETNSIVELKTVLAVAQTFKYNVSCIENRIATLIRKQQQTAHFEHDFEMAIREVEKEKEIHVASLFTAYEIMQAKGLC